MIFESELLFYLVPAVKTILRLDLSIDFFKSQEWVNPGSSPSKKEEKNHKKREAMKYCRGPYLAGRKPQ